MMSVLNCCFGMSAMLLLISACSPAGTEDIVVSVTPEQVVEQLRESYLEQNISYYTDCFADSFMFVLHEQDWEWNPHDPDSCWFLNPELAYSEDLFLSARGISLELESTPTYIWPDDSTALGMTCSFDLEVYTDSAQTMGYRAAGDAVFRFVEVSDDVWMIDYWKDQSDTRGSKESSTWGFVKAVFS